MSVIILCVRGPAATTVALLLFAIFGSFVLSAAAETPDEQKANVEPFIKDAVLAPCTYTESLSRHQSEIAVKKRIDIAKLVAAGKTDQEILGAHCSSTAYASHEPQ
jgi:cytochrome c-type biogenesis protein CcmH/NrfF